MKKKSGSGIYAYLEATGLLANGTAEAIGQAKRQYWKEVRKTWNKEHRKITTCYNVVLSTKEQQLIAAKARLLQQSPTQFIKDSALAAAIGTAMRDEQRISAIVACCLLHFSTIEQLAEDGVIGELVRQQLVQQVSELENSINDFITTLNTQ